VRLSFVAQTDLLHEVSIVFALQVLQQPPECLAIAVMAASRRSSADVEQQLSMLPASVHPLAIDAAFPSFRRHHSIALDFVTLGCPNTWYAVLHAATKDTSALEKLHLQHIPVHETERLLLRLSSVCRSVLDVKLDFANRDPQHVPGSQALREIGVSLSQNIALTSLELNFQDDPYDVINPEYLLESLQGLHNLALAPYTYPVGSMPPEQDNPLPEHIINLPRLTRLCLGPGFHLTELPQIVPQLTRLQELCLSGSNPQALPPLSPLTALETLKLQGMAELTELPQLLALNLLQLLDLRSCLKLT
jgi:hypothetical protein